MFVEWSYQDKKFRRAKHVALEGSVVTADTKIRSTITSPHQVVYADPMFLSSLELVWIKFTTLQKCNF